MNKASICDLFRESATANDHMKLWNNWRTENPEVVVDFSEEEFAYESFVGADLTKAVLAETSFYECDFSYAQLDNCTAKGSDFIQCKFFRTSFIGASICEGDFSNSELADSVFESARITQANFSGAKLPRCNFDYADFSETNFTLADLMGSSFSQTNLSQVDLNSSYLTEACLNRIQGPVKDTSDLRCTRVVVLVNSEKQLVRFTTREQQQKLQQLLCTSHQIANEDIIACGFGAMEV